MNLHEAIFTRRSVRKYTEEQVTRDELNALMLAAVQAPSGNNSQTWAFGVIQGTARLHAYGERAKAVLLETLSDMPALDRYRATLTDPNFHLFYGAPAMVLIYATGTGAMQEANCVLAAENLMLAAHDMGLGTCWIGFAHYFFDAPDVKRELGVPVEYPMVAPLVVGHPAMPVPPLEKKPPQVLFWQE